MILLTFSKKFDIPMHLSIDRSDIIDLGEKHGSRKKNRGNHKRIFG